jgi:hypothetical protein
MGGLAISNLKKRVNFRGENKVILRQTTDSMGCVFHQAFVVTCSNVGMMVLTV